MTSKDDVPSYLWYISTQIITMERLTMRFLLALCLLGALSACASTQEILLQQPVLPLVPVPVDATASAFAISVDITPPPGLPMGGYSVMANKGQGFRTRLKARVVYLQDEQGRALALVQTDLTAGSLLLHHAVTERVAQQTGLTAADIVITASHSHSAPVNFFDNDFYNKHMSSGQWLEQAYLQFVTDRIANGIIAAQQQRRPARIATGMRSVYGINRNRSLEAYAHNHTVGDVDVHDAHAKHKAVNPDLYMVRVDVQADDGRFLPLAAFSSFSVHATALSVPVEVYNADLFAYAQKDLEWAIQQQYLTPWPVVHALATGTQGDMAPALHEHGDLHFSHHPVDWKAARQLGSSLGHEALQLFEELGQQLTSNVALQSTARELSIREHHQIGDVAICSSAAVGNPVAAGAYERRTPWLAAVPFLRGGNMWSRRWWLTEGCHGHKRHLGFAWLQPLLEPKDSFPHTVLFQLMQINDMVIAPLPFEVTTEAGRRISHAVAQAYQHSEQPPRYVWVTSNANGYFGYTTTPEEYARQHYEGGHTLYGKNTTPYLAAQLQQLAQDTVVDGPQLSLSAEWRYRLKVNQFMPKPLISAGVRQWLQAPAITLASAEHEEDYIAVAWQDVNVSEINFHRRLVSVEQWQDGQWQRVQDGQHPIDDDGYDIEVRYLRELKQGMAAYQARWYNPIVGHRYRFRVHARGAFADVYSPEFSVAERGRIVSMWHP